MLPFLLTSEVSVRYVTIPSSTAVQYSRYTTVLRSILYILLYVVVGAFAIDAFASVAAAAAVVLLVFAVIVAALSIGICLCRLRHHGPLPPVLSLPEGGRLRRGSDAP